MHESGIDDQIPSLSRTLQVAPNVPIVVYVCEVAIEPGLPAFFSTLCVVPSPNTNSAAFKYPPGSTPAQVSVIVCGVPTAEDISVYKFEQFGAVLPVDFCVGVGVLPEAVVGVGVFVFVVPV